MLTAEMFGAFAVVFFVWFVGHLRHVVQRAEGGAEVLSPVVYGAGMVLAAVGACALVPFSVLAYGAKDATIGGDAGLVRVLFDANIMFGAVLSIGTALFVAATGYAMVRKELVATWLGWAGLADAIVLAVGGIATF